MRARYARARSHHGMVLTAPKTGTFWIAVGMAGLALLLAVQAAPARAQPEVLSFGVIGHAFRKSPDEALLRRLIEQHARYTGSALAREILDAWPQWRARFVKVFPKEYRRALSELAAKQKKIAA